MTFHYESPPTLIPYQPKQARSRRTVRAILDAAIAEIDTVGASGLRHQHVLDAAGVTQGSLYHHFGSRDGLIDAAFAEMFTTDIEHIINEAGSVIDDEGSGIDELLALLIGPEGFDRRRLRLNALVAAFVRPSLRPVICLAQRALTSSLIEAIETFQSRGRIDQAVDPRGLAVFLQACSIGSIITELDPETSGSTPIEPVIRAALRSTLDDRPTESV